VSPRLSIIICVVNFFSNTKYSSKKYYYFSFYSKYSYQNIIIYVLNIIIFLIIQDIQIKDIIICVILLLFL
jgi:hypothetical protein